MTAAGTLDGTELTYVQVGVAAGDERQSTTGAFKTLALSGFSANGLSLGAAADYAAMRGLLDLEAGTDFNAYSANLAALSAMGTSGLLTRTGAGTYAARTLTAPAAGITVSNGNGVSGNPTLVLADDLAALEALSGTDTIYYRSAASTWSAVTISTGLSFSGGILTATGSGGTVTASGSPSSGFLAKWTSATDITKGDLSGDVSTSGSLVTTIGAGAVTLDKIANIADQTILANNTGGAAAPAALTASQIRTLLGLVIGTNVQAYDAELAALAGLASAADKVPYFTGSGTAAVTDFTSVARTLVNQTTQALMRTTGLGLGTSATVDTGTSGTKVALTDGANTWSAAQTDSALATFSAGANMTPAATPSTTAVGYLGAPQNIQNGTYTTVMSDAGKHIYHTSGSAHTWTIDSNANVAYPIGTIIAFANENGGGVVTLAITSDTLRWGSSTGSRSLAANGTATALKVASTTWRLTGDGIT
jgi:hypothetical protein